MVRIAVIIFLLAFRSFFYPIVSMNSIGQARACVYSLYESREESEITDVLVADSVEAALHRANLTGFYTSLTIDGMILVAVASWALSMRRRKKPAA